ncbi:flavodoxin family protein [Anaerovorax odorimutans]|uniref:flavodoxin family protein n=1 Tax=Anaerovorax odorimutans TaxID=109327 RepID=UPI000410567C|nr:NAD(P)H-dependent oxidoreductase [Anaerovorax odorimutans]
MGDIILIRPHCRENVKTHRLSTILEESLKGYSYNTISTVEEFHSLQNKKILFAISLGESGINLELYALLKKIRLDKTCLEDSVAGIIIDGDSELYTKSVAREITLSANMSGCTFPGRPLVEGTKSLENYNIIAKNLDTDNFDAYIQSGKTLVRQIMKFEPPKHRKPKLLVLHASSYETSNTVNLWEMVKEHLEEDCEIKDISIRNGAVLDCIGCPYTTCMHYGEKNSCLYGGVIVKEVYPAILECDALIMLCPNYNDAISANLSAFINRLTALFRKTRFYDKYLFAVVISGYSGSDIVAQQLIAGLNMNKTFILPKRFTMMETANNPKSIFKAEGIEKRAKDFAENILLQLKGDD